MYQLTQDPANVLRTPDNTFIPISQGNTDWRAYQQWLAEGNEPLPYVEPPKGIPQVVSRFQAKAALARQGLLTNVEALMSDPATPIESRLAWQDAQEFRRTSPTVLQMGTALGLTGADLDALFTLAETIEA